MFYLFKQVDYSEYESESKSKPSVKANNFSTSTAFIDFKRKNLRIANDSGLALKNPPKKTHPKKPTQKNPKKTT